MKRERLYVLVTLNPSENLERRTRPASHLACIDDGDLDIVLHAELVAAHRLPEAVEEGEGGGDVGRGRARCPVEVVDEVGVGHLCAPGVGAA